MKLKKVSKKSINYPSRKDIKPILLSIGVAIAISGCGSNIVKEPSFVAGGMIGNAVSTKNAPSCKVPLNKEKEEVKEPESLGGVPLPPKE